MINRIKMKKVKSTIRKSVKDARAKAAKVGRKAKKDLLDQALLDSSLKTLNKVKKRLKTARNQVSLNSDLSEVVIDSVLERAAEIKKILGITKIKSTKKVSKTKKSKATKKASKKGKAKATKKSAAKKSNKKKKKS